MYICSCDLSMCIDFNVDVTSYLWFPWNNKELIFSSGKIVMSLWRTTTFWLFKSQCLLLKVSYVNILMSEGFINGKGNDI